MSRRYSALFTIEAAHGYRAGAAAEEVAFAPSPGSSRRMAGLRIITRTSGGRLLALVESEAGAPPADAAGSVLTFGFRPADPWFENVTAPVVADRSLTPLYANTDDPTKLDAPVGARLAAGRIVHVARSPARPLTVALVDPAGTPVASRTLTAGASEAAFDLNAVPPGPYRIEEDDGLGIVAASRLLADADLVRINPWGVVRIAVDAGFAANPPAFVVRFAPRTETLNYYVVLRNLKPAEFEKLTVTDKGAAAEGRPAIAFDRVPPAAFGPGELAPSTLVEGAADLVLFRSTAPAPRRERGYSRLQLAQNGEILVENLPSPAPDRADSNLVVHVSRPKI